MWHSFGADAAGEKRMPTRPSTRANYKGIPMVCYDCRGFFAPSGYAQNASIQMSVGDIIVYLLAYAEICCR